MYRSCIDREMTPLRLACRRLARSPLYTLVAVLTLGVGIAVATAMFGLVDAVLLRPLPFRDPGTLVWIWPRLTDRDRAFYSAPNFTDVVAETRSFDGLAGLAPW